MRGQLIGQELQSHHPAELDVFGFIDHAHGAPPGLGQNPVVRNDGSRCESRWFAFHGFECPDEPVALAGQCFDKAWRRCGVQQGLPQALDRRVDAVFELDHRAMRPQPGLNRLAGHHLAGTLQQHGQDGQGLIGHP
jgi:hypothetical protein